MIHFTDRQPIYLQIVDWLFEQILTEKIKIGEKLPSIRELGYSLEVNPNTVMRSYEYLQQQNIITNRRGVGFYVNEEATEKIRELQLNHFISQEMPFLFKKIKLLKISFRDLEKYYQRWAESQ